MSRSIGDENTTKTGGGPLTPEDAVRLSRAIASQPASPPRGHMVQREVQDLEPTGGSELEVVGVKSRSGALIPTSPGFHERDGDVALTPITPAQGRIRELEERLAVWVDAGREGAGRIRELEGANQTLNDALDSATERLVEATDERDCLFSRLERVRGVVRAALCQLEHAAGGMIPGLRRAVDALLPEDRAWAEGSPEKED